MKYGAAVFLLFASAAVAAPMAAAREKPNALGFYQQQPKISAQKSGTARGGADIAAQSDQKAVEKTGWSGGPSGIATTADQTPLAKPGWTGGPNGIVITTDPVAKPGWTEGPAGIRSTVPEPGTSALLAVALLALGFVRRFAIRAETIARQ